MIAPQNFINDQNYSVVVPTTEQGILPTGWREALDEVTRLKAENAYLRNEISNLSRELGEGYFRLQKMANLIQGNP